MDVVDSTYFDFVALINNAFGQQGGPSEFNLAFFAWLHYEARRIPRRTREVIISKEVRAHQAKYPAIGRIKGEFERAGDLSPWLNDPIRNRKPDPKADLMFNDWQISHFHLGDVFVKPDKVKRTGDLLYVFITPDRAVFLDVQPHRSWTMTNLLRILKKASPDDMSRFKAQGAIKLQTALTDDQLLNIRNNGMTAFIEIDGEVYMSPGMGISSSQHGTRFVLFAQNLRRAIKSLIEGIRKDNLPPILQLQSLAARKVPVKLGARMESGVIVIFDKNRNVDLITMQCLA